MESLHLRTRTRQTCVAGGVNSLYKVTLKIACLAGLLWLNPAWSYGSNQTPAARLIRHGDTVVLNQDLAVERGARIYIQDGQAIPRSAVEHRRPFCYFNLYRSPADIDSGTGITADRFSVRVARTGIEYSFFQTPSHRLSVDEYRDQPNLQLASRKFGSFGVTHEYSAENLMTRIVLGSASQPAVTDLKCGIFAVPVERRHLSLEEIQDTLGNVVTLELQ